MKYKDFIQKISLVVEEEKLLLRVVGNIISIDGKFFYESTINRIQRLLQLYGECEWWILPSDVLLGGVMYKVKILSYK
ncbi:hypothetical protein [uncultured Butyricimonas sp.]|uniref:hypothetical protein n=1 Tax=uncultured Butyricimonas sp. TaxID=1268785 RepID=UPI0026DC6A17|nr:hypothetical protein [uncultured Butyricimonas sp.]